MTRLRIALLALLVAPPIAAQDPQALPAGTLIRWYEDDRWMEGHLLEGAVPGQLLRVEPRHSSTARELAWDTGDLSYQVRPGRRWRGAAIGLGIGALIGQAQDSWPVTMSVPATTGVSFSSARVIRPSHSGGRLDRSAPSSERSPHPERCGHRWVPQRG